MGSGGGSGDEPEASNTRKGKKSYHRHTTYQIQQLEKFFKECPHPDDNQRRQLSRELGLEPKQIKFWFQNKRTQAKAQTERADNTVLRAENEKIQCEIVAIKEALKNVICPACGGPPFGEEERQRNLQKLQLENSKLKEEHEKVSNLLAKYIGKPISQIESLMGVPRSSLDFSPGRTSLISQRLESPALDLDLGSTNTASPYRLKGIPEMEKAIMLETAAGAMDELIRLLRINEPVWIKSPADGRYVLHRDSYERMFPTANHLRNATARIESSRDSGMVAMSGMHLVEMIIDSDKWSDLFPTIVTKAKTIQVLETGTSGNRSGSLQLMYEQMHILSPLVPPREFYFLRHCQQIELGMWVIVDVSYECPKEKSSLPSRSWRLPSGCMIQDLPNGCSKVTWVEHVEVDDKTQTHRLYRDLICGATAYGAERWVATLRRMCERFAYSMGETTPCCELGGGVFTLPEGKKSIVKLSHRMVKNFCGILSMSGKLDFPQLSEVNNSGVRVSVRNSTEPGQPCGMIVSAATSLWLPLPPHNVFNFFRDERTRVQWDVLSSGNPVHEIAHISNGSHVGNCTSIIRPSIPNESMLILQETCIDTLGSLVVYAPIDMPAINIALSGEDPSDVPILPSGFVISSDGRPEIGSSGASTSENTEKSSGSLLTVAFQILVSSPSSPKQVNVESVATVNTLISSTVQRIKTALNCSDLD
ncbi:homeobox-leucine zipper protein ROC8-like [Corylus avellana]|uniref:homeobox-leucine zipper protein ROC8-like n=1 Tax=Corylus avellana TaxID=13451 RepID=UPI00286AF0A7|nr:homeobox-leucine zipper protein ROC8-like [Corylus avellana]